MTYTLGDLLLGAQPSDEALATIFARLSAISPGGIHIKPIGSVTDVPPDTALIVERDDLRGEYPLHLWAALTRIPRVGSRPSQTARFL